MALFTWEQRKSKKHLLLSHRAASLEAVLVGLLSYTDLSEQPFSSCPPGQLIMQGSRMTLNWGINPGDPILGMGSNVLLYALVQRGTSAASDDDEAVRCHVVYSRIRSFRQTVMDFLDFSPASWTIARALDFYIPEEGVEHDTCVRIAQDAHDRLTEV